MTTIDAINTQVYIVEKIKVAKGDSLLVVKATLPQNVYRYLNIFKRYTITDI